ncbi:MAG: hypothetical protein RIF32_06960 [Leptospirales bacterium]
MAIKERPIAALKSSPGVAQMQKNDFSNMPPRWKDRLVDRLAVRSDRWIDRAYRRARRVHPGEPLYHGIYVVEFLAHRLTLAEYCLSQGFGYSRYRALLREL